MPSATASRLRSAWLVMAMLCLCRIAHAQEDKALAQALFDEARELMRAAKYNEACPKLAESYRLDPALGTKLNLALCHEYQGKTATAWSEYGEALTEARQRGDAKREQFAADHIAALQPKLSRVTVMVKADHEVAGLEVLRDGTPLKKPSWGTALPIDPGEHVFAATAPGYQRWQATVQIAPGPSKQVVEIPKLTPAPRGAEAAGAPTQPALVPHQRPGDAVAPQDDPGQAQRIAGFVVGGVGVAAVITGVALGVAAIREEDKADELCPPGGATDPADGTLLCTDSAAVSASENAKLDALLSNIFLFGGIGLAAIGVVVVLTAPTGEETATLQPVVGPQGAALRVTF